MFAKQIQEMVQTSYEMTNKFTKLWIENYKTYVVPMVDQTASTIEKSISAFKAK
jgi:cyclopropane fatty-acyl-phospholipid synthase-like methyltransferase